MPYVTEFNQNRIISDAATKIDKDISAEDIYSADLPFFNALELSKLHDFKKFCEGDIDLNSVYKKAEIIDRMKFVFEGKAPAYHRSENCPRLHSNFRNIVLPEEVQQWTADEIEEFRAWFKTTVSDIENDQLIIDDIKEEWGIDCDVKRVNYRNSGSIYMEDLDLEHIEQRINSLLKAQKNYYLQNRYFLRRFSKATFLAFMSKPIPNNQTNLSDSDLKEELKHYHNLFKEPITYYLKQYFKVKFGSDIAFEQNLLVTLGFKECKSCYGPEPMPISTEGETDNKKTPLDDFLLSRGAKKLCRKPSELEASGTSDPEFFEFYYFCKLMRIKGKKTINGKVYVKMIIEYIIDDNIFYEDALYEENYNEIPASNLTLYNGYLTYTRFRMNDHRDYWRQVFPFDYAQKTNHY